MSDALSPIRHAFVSTGTVTPEQWASGAGGRPADLYALGGTLTAGDLRRQLSALLAAPTPPTHPPEKRDGGPTTPSGN